MSVPSYSISSVEKWRPPVFQTPSLAPLLVQYFYLAHSPLLVQFSLGSYKNYRKYIPMSELSMIQWSSALIHGYMAAHNCWLCVQCHFIMKKSVPLDGKIFVERTISLSLFVQGLALSGPKTVLQNIKPVNFLAGAVCFYGVLHNGVMASRCFCIITVIISSRQMAKPSNSCHRESMKIIYHAFVANLLRSRMVYFNVNHSGGIHHYHSLTQITSKPWLYKMFCIL